MAEFRCQVCDEPFTVPSAALEKYPGWTPRYCRAHSPNATKAGKSSATKRPRTSSVKKKSAGGKRSSGGSFAGSQKEELLTLAEVLAKYADGEDTGMFTDGSSHPNPGPGGWGFVWVENGEIQASGHGSAEQTTNNRMELTALIEAYKALPEDAAVTVVSDSQLCVNTIEVWAPTWERNGWKRKGAPLKNLDLVKELFALRRAHPNCPPKWVRGHDGSRWNEYADSLATAWRRSQL